MMRCFCHGPHRYCLDTVMQLCVAQTRDLPCRSVGQSHEHQFRERCQQKLFTFCEALPEFERLALLQFLTLTNWQMSLSPNMVIGHTGLGEGFRKTPDQPRRSLGHAQKLGAITAYAYLAMSGLYVAYLEPVGVLRSIDSFAYLEDPKRHIRP